jgi:hypothetical protein
LIRPILVHRANGRNLINNASKRTLESESMVTLSTSLSLRLYLSYTYEICLFGQATQKAKNGASHSLGYGRSRFFRPPRLTIRRRFSSWNKEYNTGDPDYYTKQYYTGGAQCWNGPQRSVTVG